MRPTRASGKRSEHLRLAPRRDPHAATGSSSTWRPGTLCLDTGTTKNDDGREVDLTDELCALLGAQVKRVKLLERQLGRVVPYLFPHLRGALARPAARQGCRGSSSTISGGRPCRAR